MTNTKFLWWSGRGGNGKGEAGKGGGKGQRGGKGIILVQEKRGGQTNGKFKFNVFTLLRQIKVLSKDNGWIGKRKEGKGREA